MRVEQPSRVFESEQLAPWVDQICEALQYAHQHARIVHRDIKPANLMLNGKGDLKGIESRIDYLSWLGIDAVWLTPFFPSPMLDFGYDITDYCAVDPVFGNLEDFDRLVEILHARSIRLLLDFVPNHTSDKHAWFADSRSSRTSAKRDWYVWADPSPDGRPPNNWLSRFGGSA